MMFVTTKTGLFFSYAKHEETVNTTRTMTGESARKKVKMVPYASETRVSVFKDRREIVSKNKRKTIN